MLFINCNLKLPWHILHTIKLFDLLYCALLIWDICTKKLFKNASSSPHCSSVYSRYKVFICGVVVFDCSVDSCVSFRALTSTAVLSAVALCWSGTNWVNAHAWFFFCMYQSEMTWNLRGNCATYARCSVLISVLFPNQHAVSQLWKGCVKPWRRKCYGCDLQCFITVINTGLNDVKCSKASNTICIIHDPCVVIPLLLSHSTFPPVIVLPVLGKLLLPQRWSRKTSFFGSSRETDEC